MLLREQAGNLGKIVGDALGDGNDVIGKRQHKTIEQWKHTKFPWTLSYVLR